MSQTKNYIPLSKELEERIREDRENHVKNPYACSDDAVIRHDDYFLQHIVVFLPDVQ